MFKIQCLFFVLLIVSCKRSVDGSNNDNCILTSQNAGWTTTDLKSNYTIQFPDNYSVTKQQGYEGIVYDVKRDDNSVRFSYIYCNSMECYGFGGLPASFPDFINYGSAGSSIKLDQKATFCNGNLLTGVLYFTSDNDAYARLYWKDNGAYKHALDVSYNRSRHQEVIDIVKTIRRK
ncbi:hypothetical protein [Niastella populi]|uniref:Uncharacterized protein n=1 Tax=Niastella populi TaxID=550983 RepID=A0A1V9FKJ8_9BACT|nr:hypothetical protein [Niastella populi]OQP58746.1 hypothetical protein A4R26_22530 [Niastella populi]